MPAPRPTRRIYGHFSSDARLPKVIRDQNIFYSTDPDFMYCPAAMRSMRATEIERLVSAGLAVHEEEHVPAAKRVRAPGSKEARLTRNAVVLAAAVLAMLAANVYILLIR